MAPQRTAREFTSDVASEAEALAPANAQNMTSGGSSIFVGVDIAVLDNVLFISPAPFLSHPVAGPDHHISNPGMNPTNALGGSKPKNLKGNRIRNIIETSRKT